MPRSVTHAFLEKLGSYDWQGLLLAGLRVLPAAPALLVIGPAMLPVGDAGQTIIVQLDVLTMDLFASAAPIPFLS